MLEKIIQKIGPLDSRAMERARAHQEALAIPLGSLGRLHEFAVRLAGITGDPRPDIADTGVITMAGDHGVTARGVSPFPREVTREMVANFARGGAAINVLTRHVGARLTVVDIGVAGPPMAFDTGSDERVRYVSRKIAGGTADISAGPAMTREQAMRAIEVGVEVFEEEKKKGLDAVGTGDMGIGNTTPSAAIAAALLKKDPDLLVNRGAGLDEAALGEKIKTVARALEVNHPDSDDPLDVLAKVGGFEIGGIAGVVLAACAHKTPVVVDGFISSAAALLASRFHPDVKQYLFGGHVSNVHGHRLMLEALDLEPIVDLQMRLGEGTGAAFGLSVLSASSRIAAEMLTFEEARVSEAKGQPWSALRS